MLKQHAKLIANMLWICDVIVTVISFYLAYWLRARYLTQWDMGPIYPKERYTWMLLVIVPLWSILLRKFGAYRSYRTASFYDESFALAKSIVVGGALLGSIAFTFQSFYLSRSFLLVLFVLNLLLLMVARLLIRSLSWFVRSKGYNFRNVIIVGTDDHARDIAARIAKYQKWGLRLIGFVSLEEQGPERVIDGHQVIGQVSELEELIHHTVVDEAIFVVPVGKLEGLEDSLLLLEEHGVVVRMASTIFPHMIAKIRLEELETVPLLTFATVPTDSVELAVKRVFDVLLSSTLLMLTSPVMLVAALAIKLTSPGPALFKQKRCGLNGRLFTLYKFRSMFADAESHKNELLTSNEMDGPVFKIKDDPRITPVGRFIRRMSIDELPQLWNVLKGDMSIVGPRPPLPEEVGKYERWQRRRLSMRPGITCLWQISGRSRIVDFNEWVKLDLQYIDTWSLALDLKIFLKTIPVVLLQKGAA